MNIIKNYWFVIVAIVTVSTAWGQSQVKILSLEDAIKETATTQRQVNDLKVQTERIDERTKSLIDSQIRQERMIEMLLSNQQNYIKQNKN